MLFKMYNEDIINELVYCIRHFDGIADKGRLADIVKQKFHLTQDRVVYYCPDFAIRFSHARGKRMSNTVLSLSALQKYDNIPFIVCIVGTHANFLLLANSTFLKRISHSSKELRADNIRGGFNGSDIMAEYASITNEPQNFAQLFAYHAAFTFKDNLERLVESTNGIVSRVSRFQPTSSARRHILTSVARAQRFMISPEYKDLLSDLDSRVLGNRNEIVIASYIENVNLRGRIIEYLITDNGSNLKEQIKKALQDGSSLPSFQTEDGLGDYSKSYADFRTETDIKTKIMFMRGEPKGYNIDKLLEFLATSKSVYLLYLLGIDENGGIVTRLCSMFDRRLIVGTRAQLHWAGRGTRGVTQFDGKVLREILNTPAQSVIVPTQARTFLSELLNR